MTYEKHNWTHGEVITAQLLQRIEDELTTLAGNTYESDNYDYISTGNSPDPAPGSSNNKIATSKSVDRAISSAIADLDSTKTVASTDGRTFVTSITETDGKITSISEASIPIATDSSTGLVKVGANLTIDANGTLAGNYSTDGTYDSSTNKLATVSTVTDAISNLSVGTITGTAGASKTLTALGETSGQITATFSDIGIAHTQLTDVVVDGSADASGTNKDKYVMPTNSTVDTKISTAINNLTLNNSITNSSNIKTVDTLSETNGVVNITFKDINVVSSAPVSGTDNRTAGLMSVADKDALDSLADLDTIATKPDSETDDRPTKGLLSRADKDMLDSFNEFITNNFVLSENKIIGIKVYDENDLTSYTTIDYASLEGE